MRGLAAVCVMLYHLDTVGIQVLQAGYLAVDFFFALSGLVLAIAYQDKLYRKRLTAGQFMKVRFVRLYPLYAIGTLMGLCLLASGISMSPFTPAADDSIFWRAAFGVAMVPDILSRYELYPLNPPAWSLFFELAVNALFAIVLIRLRSRWLLLLWIVSFALYGVKVQHGWMRAPGANLGPFWDHLTAGLLRVSCGFAVGVMLMRLGAWRTRRVSRTATIAVVVLIAMLTVPPTLATDILAVGVILPVTIWLASRGELPERLRWSCEWLGDISYPLYATHFPVLFGVHRLARGLGAGPVVESVATVVIALALATLLVRVDVKARARLSTLLGAMPTARPQAI